MKQDSNESRSSKPVLNSSVSKIFEKFKHDGLRAVQMNMSDYALKCFDEAIKIVPDDKDVLFGRMSALASLGRTTEAIAVTDQILKIDPNDVYTALNRIAFQLRDENADINEALASCNSLIEIIRDSDEPERLPVAYLLLGRLKAEHDDVDGAITAYITALELNPEYDEAGNRIAELEYDRGNYNEALKYINKSIEANAENGDHYHWRARIYEKLNNLPDALDNYNEAAERNPYNIDAILDTVRLLSIQGNIPRAIKILTSTIEYVPEVIELYVERAKLYRMSGNIEGAKEDEVTITKLMSFDDDDDDLPSDDIDGNIKTGIY
jgi:tetratricopeptide (TPR) repeat protein